MILLQALQCKRILALLNKLWRVKKIFTCKLVQGRQQFCCNNGHMSFRVGWSGPGCDPGGWQGPTGIYTPLGHAPTF